MTEHLPERRFGPTSGLFTGIAGLAVCALIIALALGDGPSPASTRVALGAALAGVVIWAYMLRPRVILEEGGRTLLLRNAFVDRRLSLAAVKVVGVRAVTMVETDEGRFECAAVGHSVRSIVRPQRVDAITPATEPASPRVHEISTQDAMREQVLNAAEQARLHGHPVHPAERRPAVPELVLLAVLGVAFLVSLFV